MDDPGLAAVVPFRFHCHRCGHCCSGAAGYVWIDEEEIEPMARRLEMSAEAFTGAHVRTVTDPASGRLRLSLREEVAAQHGGRCSLLEGADHCRVYEDRPAHCRTFPYWSGVMSNEDSFEKARATCPGITVEPDEEVRREAFEALEALYREVDEFVARSRSVCILRGVCCRFEDAGHELYATALEADFAASKEPSAPPPEADGRCPYHVKGRCTAREGRPLGCRTYFCDSRTESVLQEAHEHFLGRIREIERRLGYPAAYGRFPELLHARGIGAR